METIIIQVMLGATEETVDVMLPAHVPLKSLMEGIRNLVMQAYQNIAFETKDVMLYDMDRHMPVRQEWTLAQSGVHDGSLLMLI